MQQWLPQVPPVHPWQKGHSRAVHRGVVAVTAGPPRTGGCRGPGWMLHRSEQLLCAGKGLLGQLFGGGEAVRHPRPLRPLSPVSTAFASSPQKSFTVK